ncbi:MAG: zinc ribbon domain-containing protein [Pseudomonadota bacterium]
MPIYEYQCQACHFELEALQKISDEPLRDCPECGSPSLRKKVSAAAFRLKGGGWYETDFKTGGKKNLAGDKAASGGDGNSSASDAQSGSSAASGTPSSNAGKTDTSVAGKSTGSNSKAAD